MELQIKIITAKDTYEVRHPELRKGRNYESCAMKGDDHPGTLHFGCYHENNLIGVASFMFFPFVEQPGEKAMQLRGMAVLEAYQGKGIGKKILQFCENLLTQRGVRILWMNARVSAIGFYTSLGYSILGEKFDIPNIGPHFIMFKSLQ